MGRMRRWRKDAGRREAGRVVSSNQPDELPPHDRHHPSTTRDHLQRPYGLPNTFQRPPSFTRVLVSSGSSHPTATDGRLPGELALLSLSLGLRRWTRIPRLTSRTSIPFILDSYRICSVSNAGLGNAVVDRRVRPGLSGIQVGGAPLPG